jgi:prepilin-type N-terminal cleavage/methylation domain-containing protein
VVAARSPNHEPQFAPPMKMVQRPVPARSRGFTLIEMLVVISIIALLAALTMGGYTYAVNGSREKTTRGTFEAVKTALESYQAEFGEYPEAANPGQIMEFAAGKSYNVGGAACLYQALSGDGFDQIKGVGSAAEGDATATSDGQISGTDEVSHVMLKEMPPSMWMRKNKIYVLIDGFSRPFQYVKATAVAAGDDPITINSTYDLWSYAFDQVNISMKSTDAKDNPKVR